MQESSRDDIRRLLKTFGIQADESLMVHLAQPLDVPEIRVRISLTDLTDYGSHPPEKPLHLEMDGSIRAQT